MFDFSVFKQLSLFQKSTHPALFSVCLKLLFFSFYIFNLKLQESLVFFLRNVFYIFFT